MKKLILTAALLSTTAANADIINCTFTEPFISSSYSMTQSSLTYTGADIKKTVIKNVSFQIKSAGIFELVSKDGKVLQTLVLNNDGSDGMSDMVYPFEVKDTGLMGKSSANLGYGGCVSNQLKGSMGDGNK